MGQRACCPSSGSGEGSNRELHESDEKSTHDRMTEIEQHSGTPPLECRGSQSSLRSIVVVTGIAAVFFSVVFGLGTVDAVVALAAFGTLVGVVRYPRRVHRTTGVLLTLIAVALLWANLRPTGWQKEQGLGTPSGMDPITEKMFWRGWPLSPFMVCLVHGMKFHPEPPLEQAILVFDGMVFVAVLFAVKGTCAFCFRRRDKSIIETPPNPPQPQSGTVAWWCGPWQDGRLTDSLDH
jgi:hypothetical protein